MRFGFWRSPLASSRCEAKWGLSATPCPWIAVRSILAPNRRFDALSITRRSTFFLSNGPDVV
eukprot:scaffold299211_cov28-Tisochrysis_lutea.AAC.1